MTNKELEEHVLMLIERQTLLEDRIEELETLVYEDVVLMEMPDPSPGNGSDLN